MTPMSLPLDPADDEGAEPAAGVAARSGPAPDDAPTVFASDTSVSAVGGGRYEARMIPSWWIINGPNGGYVAAVMMRAIVAEVDDPRRRPRSIHLHFLRAPLEGVVHVDVTVERTGRSVSNVSARMVQDGRLLVVALGVLATERPSVISFDEGPGLPLLPSGSPVPMPESVPCVEADPDREVPMRSHYELRWVLGDLPFRPSATGERKALTGGWLRPAEPEPIDEVVLAAMADAWMPPIFSRIDQPIAVPTIDLTIHFRDLPTDPQDFCFVVFDSPLASGGYLVEHGRILDRDGRLLAESRQLAVVA